VPSNTTDVVDPQWRECKQEAFMFGPTARNTFEPPAASDTTGYARIGAVSDTISSSRGNGSTAHQKRRNPRTPAAFALLTSRTM
jgi:hypothetical protein